MTPWETEQTARDVLARWRSFLGHIEDMTDDERLFMLGMMAGSLENVLALRGRTGVCWEKTE